MSQPSDITPDRSEISPEEEKLPGLATDSLPDAPVEFPPERDPGKNSSDIPAESAPSPRPFFLQVKDKIAFFFQNAPKIAIAVWILTGIAAILHILSTFSPAVADFLVRYPNRAWRWIAAKLTMWIPFSLAEMLIIAIPVILILLIALGVYVTLRGTSRQYVRLLSSLLAVIAFFYASFVLTLAPGYQGSTLDDRMELDRKPVSADDLYSTGRILADGIDSLLDEITFVPGKESVMPYTLDQMNDILNAAYVKASDKYDFIAPLHSNIKYVVLSEPMSYTHITGVYTYFTGEANLNVNFPDYTLPYTAAHEFAHQRGIAREDEANFVAFLAAMESDDVYLRYSATVNLLEYVMNALGSADRELYVQLYRSLDPRLIGEFNAYAEFYEKYRENKVADVSNAVNNGYLQSQGVKVGSRSYGLVVDLAVAYYKNAETDS